MVDQCLNLSAAASGLILTNTTALLLMMKTESMIHSKHWPDRRNVTRFTQTDRHDKSPKRRVIALKP